MSYCITRRHVCYREGDPKFCGFCLLHWQEMSTEMRKELLDLSGNPPLERQIITRIYPRSKTAAVLLFVWRLGITAGVAWVTWGKWRGR